MIKMLSINKSKVVNLKWIKYFHKNKTIIEFNGVVQSIFTARNKNRNTILLNNSSKKLFLCLYHFPHN